MATMRAATSTVPKGTPTWATVHVLRGGRAACDDVRGMPATWPPGHRWVHEVDAAQSTCTSCLDALKRPARPAPRAVPAAGPARASSAPTPPRATLRPVPDESSPVPSRVTYVKPNNLGEFIRAMRKEAGMSLRAAAEEVGVSHVYLDQLERGEKGTGSARWPHLALAIPGITVDRLRRAAEADQREVVIRTETMDKTTREIVLRLANAVESGTMPREQVRKVLDALSSG